MIRFKLELVWVALGVFLTACGSASRSAGSSTTGMGTSADARCSKAGVALVAPYKGIWAPSLLSGLQSIDTPEEVSGLNANLMSVVFPVKVSTAGVLTPKYAWSKLGTQIDLFHGAGLAVVLSLDTEMEGGSSSSPQMGPDLVFSDTFQSNLTQIASQLAEVGKKCGVAVFIPYNDADLKMGPSAASDWGQQSLASLKATYSSGKILWKVGSVSNINEINATGYDMVGVSFSPTSGMTTEEFKTQITSDFETAKSYFQAQGITEFWISQFGVWGSEHAGLAQSVVDDYYSAGFEAMALLEYSGLMAFDGLQGIDPQLKGTGAGSHVALYFGSY